MAVSVLVTILSVVAVVMVVGLFGQSLSSSSPDSSRFIQEEMCNVEESIERGCSIVMDGVRSTLSCARMCWSDTECVGVSMYNQDVTGDSSKNSKQTATCVHHQLCHVSVTSCSATYSSSNAFNNNNNSHRYMARYCIHGTYNSSSQSCVCRYGTFGERCNQFYTSCDHLLGQVEGLAWQILNPLQDITRVIKIPCRVFKTNVRMRLLLNTGRSDFGFNRTWNEYVNGFIIDDRNFWAGLEAWHILGQAIGDTAVMKIAIHFDTFGRLQAHYKNFKVLDRDSGYALTLNYNTSTSFLSAPEGQEAGDCLSSFHGVPFSTWDKDNRQTAGSSGRVTGENCASLAGSGWWYKGNNCDNPCHILGYGLGTSYNDTASRQKWTFLGLDENLYQNVTFVRWQLG